MGGEWVAWVGSEWGTMDWLGGEWVGHCGEWAGSGLYVAFILVQCLLVHVIGMLLSSPPLPSPPLPSALMLLAECDKLLMSTRHATGRCVACREVCELQCDGVTFL